MAEDRHWKWTMRYVAVVATLSLIVGVIDLVTNG